ncbi:MAG: TCP-1/cpn60 chaperonin family protein, partial [Halorubrum sp.]|uniref:TCP-1/cpn60 chaperonin family protein n=1 Tax=Halorubrum sp. TaxID=1879286 RepID=UPI0039708BAF
GILAVRRAKSGDLKRLARATGGRVVSNLEDIESDDLGFAGSVAQKDIGGDERIFVEDVEEAKSVTLILRGGTEHVVDEVERAIEDSLGVVRTTLLDGQILPGGGAAEAELALQLRDFADSVGGREQLAVEAFADALEVVPRTLAENAGLDPIDSLVDLRSRHDAGEFGAGLDAYTGDVIDMEAEGVVEPLRVKTQAIESATEAAVMILRIDDVIAAGDLKGGSSDDGGDEGGPGGAPGGMGGGMGGMGGMGGAM